MPDLNEFPLFVPIPFVICIETTSPPLSRSKAGAHPQDKPVFPAVPTSYRLLEFTLRRHISIRSRGDSWHDSSETIAYIGAAARAAVKQSIPERVWVPLGHGRDGASEDPSPDPMGTWVQRATFWSTFRLDCSHSFSVHNITCTVWCSSFFGCSRRCDALLMRRLITALTGPEGTIPGYWE